MNHDVTMSTTLCCHVVTLLCASLYMPFLDSLAHGCPTYTGYMARWHLVVQLYAVLNSTTCYFVGTWVPNTCSDQLRCTFFFHLAGRASSCCAILCDIYYYTTSIISPAVICDTLWTSDTSCTCSGSTLCVSTAVYDVFFYEHCYYMDVSLLVHLFVQTSPCSTPSLYPGYVIGQHHI